MADPPKLMTPDEALQAAHEVSLGLLAIAKDEMRHLQAKERLDPADVRKLAPLARFLRDVRSLFEKKEPQKPVRDDMKDEDLEPSEFIQRLLSDAEGSEMAEKVHAARNGGSPA